MSLATVPTRLRNRAVAAALVPLLPRSRDVEMVRIGSDYGGWWVPAAGVLGSDSVCYVAGAGTDITFDMGLMDRFGCNIISVDPTPRAIEYVRSVAPATGYSFLPVGLGGTHRVERFYAPSNPNFVSHSIANSRNRVEFFEAALWTVSDLMNDQGHDHLDLLKLDIEGAEYEVLDSLHRDRIFPTILCVEFDQPRTLRSIVGAVRRLRSVGYKVVRIEGFNVTLLRPV